jgi:hypothetical protein
VDWLARFAAASTMDELRDLWRQAGGANALDEDTRKAWHAKGMELKAAARGAEPEAATGTEQQAQEPDRDQVWTEIMGLAAQAGWATDELMDRFQAAMGVEAYDADGWTYEQFRDSLKSGAVA